jgi:two-component system LytT family response regulator
MLRCIIIDDEQHAREFLESMLAKYFGTKTIVMENCSSIAEGVEAINKFKPDLVFLDIQMTNEKGFKLFQYFEYVFFDVIFTTAHKEYAIEAIKHSAHDYLLKPINQIDLFDAFKRLDKKQLVQSSNIDFSSIIENLNFNPHKYGKIALPTEKGYTLEKISNILYCEGQSNYVKIHTYDGKSILVTKTLKAIEEMLPAESFFRVHKSYLVNLNFVVKYDKSMGLFVELTNAIKIPVSVRNNSALINAITSKN